MLPYIAAPWILWVRGFEITRTCHKDLSAITSWGCSWKSPARTTCQEGHQEQDEEGFGYPLVMTNSSPWYRWPIEIDGLPIKTDDFPWRTVK